MHAAQTAWLTDHQNQRDFTGGWPAAKFHLYSWALSSHCLARHYPQCTLVADTAAADLLVGQMQLPYTCVDLALDTFDNPFPKLWVLKKTLAYARQPGPFAHVDSDAYLFAPLPLELAQAPLFAQNLEYDHPYYLEAQKDIDRDWLVRPEWVSVKPGEKLWAFNAGLVGGLHYQFYAEYHAAALKLLLANEAALMHTKDWYNLNVYVEQAGMVGLARQMGLRFQSLMPKPMGYPCVYDLDQFWRLPNRCGYLHAMNYKQNPAFCEQLAQRLRLEALELYERANQVARELAATHHPIPERPTAQLSRLGAALAHVGLALPTGPPADWLAQITANGLPQLQPTERAVLGDLLAYEQAWLDACAQGQNILAQPGRWANIERAANEGWGRDWNWSTAHVAAGPLLALIESQWNWAGANEFARQKQAHGFAEQVATAPSYFVVVALPYIELGIWREYRLEPLEIWLFSYLEAGPASGAALVGALLTDLPENGQPPQTDDVAQWVEDRLRFFSYFGVIIG